MVDVSLLLHRLRLQQVYLIHDYSPLE
jgi:hypothetical protein